MALKYDPKIARDMFVSQGMSLRDIAKALSVSPSTLSAKSRADDWPGQKMAYEAAVARRSYENMAEGVAQERGEIARENVLAARATIRKYLADLSSGKVHVGPKEAEMMMRFLAEQFSGGEGLKHDEPKNVTPGVGADSSFLKQIIEMSRTKVAQTNAIGPGDLKLH